jgi:hypothetical protein
VDESDFLLGIFALQGFARQRSEMRKILEKSFHLGLFNVCEHCPGLCRDSTADKES